MSYKVGIAWRDTGVRRRQTLFETCGLRDIQYGGHTAPVLDSAVREMVSFFTSHGTFVPVQGRTKIHSLDMISDLSVGANLRAITSRGFACMDSYVACLRAGNLAPKFVANHARTTASVAATLSTRRNCKPYSHDDS